MEVPPDEQNAGPGDTGAGIQKCSTANSIVKPSVREAARLLGGDVVGGEQILRPGPSHHSKRDRSLSVKLVAGAVDGFVVHSFAGDDPILCRQHVRRCLGIASGGYTPSRRPQHSPELARDDKWKIERAYRTWEKARPIAGTPAERYLASRGLAYTGDALVYTDKCPVKINASTVSRPAVLAAMRDIRSGEFRGYQATFLTADGLKDPAIEHGSRPTYGSQKGAVIKLSADETVDNVLGIAEGVETALSLPLFEEARDIPVWSVVGSINLERFPPLPGVECLWIAIDSGEAGEKAFNACAVRWHAAGAEVHFIEVRRGERKNRDLNDIIQAWSL